MRFFSVLLLALFTLVISGQRAPQAAQQEPQKGYQFTDVVRLKATPVKNQASTGTCWCFATTSFIESELLRMGKGEYDLSEMYTVRYNYIARLRDNYLRRGAGNLGQGSLAHNVMFMVRDHGMVPEEVYTGINYDSPLHNHGELNKYINAIGKLAVDARKESNEYWRVVNSVLDVWLGPVPEKFTYKGKSYTPKSFAAELGINPDDYVEITSFSHFPFYTQFPIEVPDNWTNTPFYNVPLDEMMQVMDYALNNGYTVAWDGDVSEKGFSHAKGVAINPAITTIPDTYSTTDRARFERMTPAQRQEAAYQFDGPVPEIKVTQEIRQAGYENFSTGDDHLMHVTGIVKDQAGNKYYITKNSWGPDNNPFGGYLNMSESYVRAKTIFIMIHKNAVPAAIKTKLGIK